jgi:hypothetical protein
MYLPHFLKLCIKSSHLTGWLYNSLKYVEIFELKICAKEPPLIEISANVQQIVDFDSEKRTWGFVV